MVCSRLCGRGKPADGGRRPFVRNLMLILWPSFIAAGIASAVFFAIFDPADLAIFWSPLGPSRMAVYSEGFLLFWAFTAASSALTLLLQRSSEEVNQRCPLEPTARPPGCPIRTETHVERP
jgi:hypothetical protein